MESLGMLPPGLITTQVAGQVKLSGRVTTQVKTPALSVKCMAMERVKGKEKFDHWINESVKEIVKNLQEAPLFVHMYGGNEPSMKMEKAVAEEWAHMKEKWGRGEESSPEGIILVEELEEGNFGINEESEGQNNNFTKAWGVLIQGKGENEGFGCYLLKTSRVGCCTHYCLVKVKNFRETVKSQLISCWLA
ncbi:hypothetical protein vseg_008804 [Gypsophila vaccaria]